MTVPAPAPGADRPAVRAIVFDLDDTLYPEQTYVFSGYRAVAGRFADRLGDAAKLEARMRQLFASTDRPRVFNVIAEEADVPDAETLVAQMVEAYRNHRPQIELFDDARRALDRLAVRFKLGLISDGYLAAQKAKVDALRLADRFDAIVLTDQWGREFWKPHPKSYEEIANRLKVPHAACVFVADNCAKDFISPNRLGWRTIYIHRPNGVYEGTAPPEGGEPHLTIESLDELDAALNLNTH